MTLDATGTPILPNNTATPQESAVKKAVEAAAPSTSQGNNFRPAYLLHLSEEAQEYLSSLTQLQEMMLREDEPGTDILS